MKEGLKSFLFKVFFFVFGVTASLGATAAEAAGAGGSSGPDLSALTGSIGFGTVTTAVLSVAGMLAVVYVAIKGASLALSMIRR